MSTIWDHPYWTLWQRVLGVFGSSRTESDAELELFQCSGAASMSNAGPTPSGSWMASTIS